jgi:type II intron maturase
MKATPLEIQQKEILYIDKLNPKIHTINGKLIHISEHIIIQHFTAILRGILNLYAFTNNFTRFLARLKVSDMCFDPLYKNETRYTKTFKKYGPD